MFSVCPVATHVSARCSLATVRARPVAAHDTRAVCSSQSTLAQRRRTLRELFARHSRRSPKAAHVYASCLLVRVRACPAAAHVYASCSLVTARVRSAAAHVTRAVCSSQSAFAESGARLRELSARHSPRSPIAAHVYASCSLVMFNALAQRRRMLRELFARRSPRSPSGDARLRELSARLSPRSPKAAHVYASCSLDMFYALAQRRRTFTRAVCSSLSAFAQLRRTLRELNARQSPRSHSGDARSRELLPVIVRVRPVATHVTRADCSSKSTSADSGARYASCSS
jgi:hypothetical protein